MEMAGTTAAAADDNDHRDVDDVQAGTAPCSPCSSESTHTAPADANGELSPTVAVTANAVESCQLKNVTSATVATTRNDTNSSTAAAPACADNSSLFSDLLQIKSLYANSHLSDVLFVFASEKRTASAADNAATATATDASNNNNNSDNNSRNNSNDAPEHHLLPAHRLVLALRSGTFRTALLRTKSSHLPAQVRFPLKIHVQDTSFRVFAALVRFLYTNDAPVATAVDDAFWRELLRASFVYLVPALLEVCVTQIERVLSGPDSHIDSSSSNSDRSAQALVLLRNALDVLVFTDSVLEAKHPAAAAAATRRVSQKVAGIASSNATNESSRASAAPNGQQNALTAPLESSSSDETDDADDLGLARCVAAIAQLQTLCVHKLTAASERDFAAVVHSDAGRRCSTSRLCDVLTQRSDSPLVVAIRYELGRVVHELLTRGASLDVVGADEHDLPLVAALKTGNDAIVRRLLVPADAPYYLLTDKVPQFLLASASGSVQHCRILLEHAASADGANATTSLVNMVAQLDSSDKDMVVAFGRNQTPLHIASRKGHAAVVELLLHHGAVPNLQDVDGNTALHCVGTVATAETLLDSSFKTNANIPNRRGRTPLHVAAAKGDVGVVDLLIRSSCQQDIVDDQGQTAFHVAAAHGHTSVALILLRENESFERTQLHRRTTEKLAAMSGIGTTSTDSDATSATSDSRTDSLLGLNDDGDTSSSMDATAHFVVNQADLKGNTALHLAAMSPTDRCQKMLQLLLENGADPNVTNWFGYTPLHLFCAHQSGPASVIDVFIEHGVDIHLQSLDGSTALHLAVGGASESVAVALVVAGAQVHLQDAAGRSVVSLAETTSHGAMLVPVLRNLARAPEWVADDQARECASCHTAFRVAMRKHHCRHCGRVVCYNCSSQKIAIPKFQLTTAVRVCGTCYDVLAFRRLL